MPQLNTQENQEDPPVLQSAATEEQQREAAAIGWQGPDKYQGDPEKFVDADVYLERGKHIIPIVNQRNRALAQQNAELARQVAQLTTVTKNTETALKALQDAADAETKEKVEAAIGDLKSQLKRALDDGDADKVAEIMADMTELNVATAAAAGKPSVVTPPKKDEPNVEINEATKNWLLDPANSWFNKDKRKTFFALGVLEEIRDEAAAAGVTLTHEEALTKMAAEVERAYGKPAGTNKVGSGNRRAGAGGDTGGGKSYSEMPADAKQACDYWTSKLVGPGKKFKTAADWQKNYAKTYWADRA